MLVAIRDLGEARAGRVRRSLFVEEREIPEAGLERGRLGLGGGQRWGAGGKAQTIQDGVYGLGRLDRGRGGEVGLHGAATGLCRRCRGGAVCRLRCRPVPFLAGPRRSLERTCLSG